MRIRINGEERTFDQGLTVADLLLLLDLGSGGIAVERNAQVVPRSTFATTSLEDGDVLEVVRFVGGG